MTIEQVRQILRYLRQDADSDFDKVTFMETFFEDLLEKMEREALRSSKTAEVDSSVVAA